MNFDFDLKKLNKNEKVLSVLAIVVIAILIFQAGIFVGYRKAAFSFHLGENYYREFDSHGGPMMGGFPRGDLPSGSGAVGKIVKVTLPTFVVASPDNLEKIIVIDSNTILRQFRNTITQNDLKVDDTVVVIGTPNTQGQIVAKLVRLLPSPMASSTLPHSSTTSEY